MADANGRARRDIPPPPVALNCGPHSSKEGYRTSAEIWPDFRFHVCGNISNGDRRGTSHRKLRRLPSAKGPLGGILVTNDNSLDRGRQFINFATTETGVAKHRFEFLKCVGVSRWRATEHLHAEDRRLRRANAIVVRDKFQSHRAATIRKRGMNFPQQRFASRFVEMMQEVCK